MTDRYEVDFEPHGRAGWMIYRAESELKFPWEVGGDKGLIVEIPSQDEWKDFCIKSNAEWALNERDKIITRLAKDEARKPFWWGGEYEIEEKWIYIFPGRSWLTQLLDRLFHSHA
jgi:hypothetical protein